MMGIEHDLIGEVWERIEALEAKVLHKDEDVKIPGSDTPIPPMEPVASIPDPPTEA